MAGKKPCALGVYDMYGNIWEWCQDGYAEEYGTEPDEDYRVCRSNPWFAYTKEYRSANRDYDEQDYKGRDCGLRLVMDL